MSRPERLVGMGTFVRAIGHVVEASMLDRIHWFGTLWQDISYSGRTLRGSPAFSLTELKPTLLPF